MNRLLAFIAGLLLTTSAFAADVVTTMTVLYNGQKVYTQTNTFYGMTDEQAAALEKTGLATLDYASRRQNKNKCSTCDYSIEWTWGNNPTIITENHTYQGVNAILRTGVRWLDDRVTASEINRARGKKKPWGN